MTSRSSTSSSGPRAGVDIVAPGPNDRSELIAFLDAQLRPRGPTSVSEDLPLLFSNQARARQLIVRRAGRIVSHAACYTHRYRTLVHPGEAKAHRVELDVGIICAVATAPDQRGNGFARTLIEKLLDAHPELDAVVLWSQVPGFYEKLGFATCGHETIHRVDAASTVPPLPDGATIRDATRSDLETLASLHARALHGTARSTRTWEVLFGIPNTRFLVCENEGIARTYGVIGKGADLQGCLHDWGGDPAWLPSIAASAGQSLGLPEIFVMSAPWSGASGALERAGAERFDGVLGMVLVPDFERLLLKMRIVPETAPADPAERLQWLFGDEPARPRLPLHLGGLDSM